MKSNDKPIAALTLTLLLAACGGRGYAGAEYGPSSASARQPPLVQPEYGPPGRPAPATQPAYSGTGASYAAPGGGDYAGPPPGAGPRGTSGQGADPERYDEVGYAGVRAVGGGPEAASAVVAIHPTLPANSFVEVTSLDTGRTILVLVSGTGMPGGGALIDLSPMAARMLGADRGVLPVRVRKVVPSAQDQGALRRGVAASQRLDAPPMLVTALRKRLPAGGPVAATPPSAPPPTRPGPRPGASRPAPVRGGWIVQVAALSSQSRAQSLAQSLGGFVSPSGRLYRVQMGPFGTSGEAEAARARAVRSGFGDAHIYRND